MPAETFQRKMVDLGSCLAIRDASLAESEHRNRTYYRHLADLHQDDFVEACDRILFSDEWFPTIARIRAVADECMHERGRQRQARLAGSSFQELVCPTCHGTRWVRLGGADPLGMHAGESGSRVQPCPRCTTNGTYDQAKERAVIFRDGGVRNPDARPESSAGAATWPARMDELRGPDGRVDMDALYRLSRELRGLDPDVDERPPAVAGWRRFGETRRVS